MPAFPAKSEIYGTYPNPSNATAREGFGKLYDATTGLLGTSGDPSDARATLGIGSAISNRNRLINSNFIINQRAKSGTVVLAAGAYGHDRWKAAPGGCTYTFAQSGADVVITITAGKLQQVVEGINMEGGSYCLSWFGTSQGRIGAGAAGPSGVTAAGVAANATCTIEFGTGTLSRVQLEPGTAPTPYERRLFHAEVAGCQRYYETGTGMIGGNGAAGIGSFQWIPFKVSKRAVPTLTYGVTTSTNVSTFDARAANFEGLQWYCVTAANGAFVWVGYWTADCEL